MTLWKNNLLLRLVSYFLLVSLTTTAVTGIAAYYLARETLTELIYAQLNSVATIKEDELQYWVNNQEAELAYISELPHLQAAAHNLLQLEKANVDADAPIYQEIQQETIAHLNQLMAHKPAFSEILIMAELGGKVVASTEPSHIDSYRILDSYFEQGKEGPYRKNPYTSPYTRQAAMSVSRPIHDDAGERLGVIAIHLSLIDMDNIIARPAGLGETGHVYLIDQRNAFFSGEPPDRDDFQRGAHSEGINRAVAGESGQDIYANYEGIDVIGIYKPLEDLERVLMAEIAVTEAFAPARRLAFFILAVGATVTLFLGIIIYTIAQRITQPILAIADAAVQVAAGNLSVTAPITSNDEVGTLARTFNLMVSQLKDLYAGLEQKVNELQIKEQALRHNTRRLEAQREIDRAILKAQLPQDIALAALSHLHDLIDCHRVSVILFDEENQEATILASFSQTLPEQYPGGKHLPISEISSYATLSQGKNYIVKDLSQVSEPTQGQYQMHLLSVRSYISLPLISRGILIGALNLGSTDVVDFSTEDIEIAREVADQLAIALQQAQLFTATQRQLQELSLLHAISTASAEANSENELLQRATEALVNFLDLDNYGVMLLDQADHHGGENGRFLQVHPSYQGTPHRHHDHIPLDACVVGKVAHDGHPRRLADVHHHAHHYTLDPLIRSQLCVPLKVSEQVIGVLNAESRQPDAFSAADERLLLTLANQLAIAIQKLRLLEQTQEENRERRRAELALREAHDKLEQRVAERTAELTLLNHATQTLISSLEISDVLISVLEELRRLLNVRACAVWLVDETSGELVCQHSSGAGNEAIRGWHLPPGTGIVGWVAQTGQSDLTHDVTQDNRHYHFPDGVDHNINLTARSLLSVPLHVKEHTIGVLQVLDTKPGRFNESDLALVESLAATAAFAIENARLYNQARDDAETKSILLREVNHRVKNNLSAIIGILYAERRHADLKDEAVYQAIMQDLINRVQGLATVHSLFSHAHWGPVSLSKMTTQVIYSSLRALPPQKKLHVSVTPSAITVLPDQASNLALIVNELTTNAIKYALDERNEGHIEVKIEQAGQQATLTFQDDGPGFPPDVLATTTYHNVGFHLIQNLVRRSLKGNLILQNQVNGQTGATVVISFQLAANHQE
jgi:GAF domain-containing protein/HAMP domain-containing protein